MSMIENITKYLSPVQRIPTLIRRSSASCGKILNSTEFHNSIQGSNIKTCIKCKYSGEGEESRRIKVHVEVEIRRSGRRFGSRSEVRVRLNGAQGNTERPNRGGHFGDMQGGAERVDERDGDMTDIVLSASRG